MAWPQVVEAEGRQVSSAIEFPVRRVYPQPWILVSAQGAGTFSEPVVLFLVPAHELCARAKLNRGENFITPWREMQDTIQLTSLFLIGGKLFFRCSKNMCLAAGNAGASSISEIKSNT